MYHNLKKSKEFGVNIENVELDFENVMVRVRESRLELSKKYSVNMLQNSVGIDIYLGYGYFTGKT